MAPTPASFAERASGSERVRGANEPKPAAERECVRWSVAFDTTASPSQLSTLEYGRRAERLRQRCTELRHARARSIGLPR